MNSASKPAASNRRTLSIGQRLWLVMTVNVIVLMTVGTTTYWSLRNTSAATEHVANLSQVQKVQQNIDMYHDSLRAEVLAMLSAGAALGWERKEFYDEFQSDVKLFRLALFDISGMDGGDAVNKAVTDVMPVAQEYIEVSVELANRGPEENSGLTEDVAHFLALFQQVKSQQQALTSRIEQAIAEAESNSDDLTASGFRNMLYAISAATLLLLVTQLMVSQSIQRLLSSLVSTSKAIANGKFDQQAEVRTNDEMGELAQCLNQMATNLRGMIERLQYDSKRDGFSKEVVEALEMSDTELEVHYTFGRALTHIIDQPAELLLADSSKANLERAACHGKAGAAGCSVKTPFSCIAVRRGSMMTYADSESLNSCPRLRERQGGQVSAVCIPLSFMGRSLGVLHTTGKTGELPSTEAIEKLNTLSQHAGARIGTVRAFDKTQKQASTDSLTGLANRWAGEERISRMTKSNQSFAFVMADLDNFKRLNDTHGHQAGDKALKTFADVLRKILRADDLPCRWGGEEFAIIMPGASAATAMKVVDRIRQELATTIEATGSNPFTSSFGVADTAMTSDFEQLSGIADEALYQSKTSGRNRATLGSSELLFAHDLQHKAESDARIDIRLLSDAV